MRSSLCLRASIPDGLWHNRLFGMQWHTESDMQGSYVFKLLALDVPSAAGPEQRIYIEGDERIYNRGSVIRELRDPFLNVGPHWTTAM
jgi:hypothetical protein